MADKGYIRIDRKILDWRWSKNPNTAYLFIVMILLANYKDMNFEGIKIKRGQFVTSLKSLSKTTGLTVQEVRTGILHLKSTGEITDTATSKFRIITIVNYNDYQESTSRSTSTSTSKQQAINKQSTTREIKGIQGIQEKKYKKGRSAPESPSGKNDSHLRLAADEGTVDDIPDCYRDMFDNFADYWRWRNQ